MSTTLVETTRALHENIERYVRAICEELDFIPENVRYRFHTPYSFDFQHKENAIQVHRVNKYLENMMSCAEKLASIYEDKDG